MGWTKRRKVESDGSKRIILGYTENPGNIFSCASTYGLQKIGGYQDTLLVYDGLVRWAVPMFVMISGSIFLNEGYPVTIKKMWVKILHIVLAMAFWTGVYCIFENSRGTSWNTIQSYIINGYWHLWFIWLIAGLYMITPILREISKNRTASVYYILLFMIFASVVPTLRYSILPNIGFSNNEVVNGMIKNIDSMNLHFVLGYTGYFLGGHNLSEKELSGKNTVLCVLLGIIGFIINIGGNVHTRTEAWCRHSMNLYD